MPEKEVQLSSIASRWEMDEEEELFRVVTKEESGLVSVIQNEKVVTNEHQSWNNCKEITSQTVINI